MSTTAAEERARLRAAVQDAEFVLVSSDRRALEEGFLAAAEAAATARREASEIERQRREEIRQRGIDALASLFPDSDA